MEDIFKLSHANINLVKRSLIHIPNKAKYMATTVACGWAGAVFEVT